MFVDLEERQQLPIHAEIDLDDMTYDESAKTFHLDCRCGGEGFTVTEEDLERGVDRIACATCSLMIKLMYQIQEDTVI